MIQHRSYGFPSKGQSNSYWVVFGNWRVKLYILSESPKLRMCESMYHTWLNNNVKKFVNNNVNKNLASLLPGECFKNYFSQKKEKKKREKEG